MFYGCTSIETIDLSNITGTETNIDNAFYGCTSLKTIDISGIRFSDIPANNRYNTFFNVPTNCTIYVKDADAQTKLSGWFPSYTFTIKT